MHIKISDTIPCVGTGSQQQRMNYGNSWAWRAGHTWPKRSGWAMIRKSIQPTTLATRGHWDQRIMMWIYTDWYRYMYIYIYIYNVTKTPLRLYTWTEPHFIAASPRPMTEYDTWLRIKHFKTHKETWKLLGLMACRHSEIWEMENMEIRQIME